MNKIDVSRLVVANPKQNKGGKQGSSNWYSYYAGFSSDFSSELIKSSGVEKGSNIIDPWNGGGTTTYAASLLEINSIGYDLNPVMVIAAKAQNFNRGNAASVYPLISNILKRAGKSNFIVQNEPLEIWFDNKTAAYIRNIEYNIQKLLINNIGYTPLASDLNKLNSLSDIASFFYVGLFNTVRKLLASFYASNPTWIKKPKSDLEKISIDFKIISSKFKNELNEMTLSIKQNLVSVVGESTLQLATSELLPAESSCADLIITSPPYCTRIDYAVATMAELAVLGITADEFKVLRQKLIGSSTIWSETPLQKEQWGVTCNKFLSRVEEHHSKASKSYYLKNHLQYFESIYNSAKEIVRVMKPDSLCAIVVQDSYYKDVHNNLPQVFTEIFSSLGLSQLVKKDFVTSKNKASINPQVKKYRASHEATESVIVLTK